MNLMPIKSFTILKQQLMTNHRPIWQCQQKIMNHGFNLDLTKKLRPKFARLHKFIFNQINKMSD